MILYFIWGLLVTLLTVGGGIKVWDALNARLDEVKTNFSGVETPLQWDKAIKSMTMCMLIGIATMIAAAGLGEVAEELIAYFSWYDDNE